jgi:hypothetical protein
MTDWQRGDLAVFDGSLGDAFVRVVDPVYEPAKLWVEVLERVGYQEEGTVSPWKIRRPTEAELARFLAEEIAK